MRIYGSENKFNFNRWSFMKLRKYFYEKFKDIFINEIGNNQDVEYKKLFEEFISSFDNKYIDKNEKDLNFRKKFIRKYCNYLFFNNIVNFFYFNLNLSKIIKN